jgi:hypothetical protein
MALKPAEVVVLEPYTKGKIELVPFTELRMIGTRATTTSPMVKVGNVVLGLQEPVKPRDPKSSDWRSETLFVPYWWVTPTPDERLANMTLTKRVMGSVSFNVFVNNRKVDKYERLCYHKPKSVAPVPLSSAAKVDKKVDNKRKR